MLLQVADVSCGGLTHSAVLSPLSTQTALLNILRRPTVADGEPVTLDLVLQESDEELTDLPDVVSSVLNVVYDLMKDEDLCDGEAWLTSL